MEATAADVRVYHIWHRYCVYIEHAYANGTALLDIQTLEHFIIFTDQEVAFIYWTCFKQDKFLWNSIYWIVIPYKLTDVNLVWPNYTQKYHELFCGRSKGMPCVSCGKIHDKTSAVLGVKWSPLHCGHGCSSQQLLTAFEHIDLDLFAWLRLDWLDA